MYAYVRQQRAIALLSCESEFYAMASGLSEGLLLHDLTQYLLDMKLKLEVRTDSSSVLSQDRWARGLEDQTLVNPCTASEGSGGQEVRFKDGNVCWCCKRGTSGVCAGS